MLKLTCATKCSILHIHPQLLSQDSQHFTLTLAILPGVAVPHLERGTTIVQHYHTWAATLSWLKWPLGLRGYLYPSSSSPTSLSLLLLILARPNRKEALSLPPLLTSSPPSKSIDFPINPWGKRVLNSIREQLHWFPNSKENLVHVLASGCVCYS